MTYWFFITTKIPPYQRKVVFFIFLSSLHYLLPLPVIFFVSTSFLIVKRVVNLSSTMRLKKMTMLMVVIIVVMFRHSNGLNMNYYIMTCPMVEFIIKNSVNSALRADPTLAAGLIRMHFHDCFIEVLDSLPC